MESRASFGFSGYTKRAEAVADELKADAEKSDSLLRDMESITNWVDVFMTELRLRTGELAGEEDED